MFSPSLILVVILGLFLAYSTEAFVGNNDNHARQRRGARGQAAASTRTAPATATTATALHMAPKKKKKATGETLRKKDIVAAVAEQCDMTKVDAEAAVSAVFDTITDVVVQGDRINVAGFGTFEPRQRAARKGRNPKTGAEITIQASTSCGFSAAKQLKDQLNGR